VGEPRAFTPDEIRDQLIAHVRGMARYWAGLDGSNVPEDYTPLQRTMGLSHSILAMLDGCSMDLPAFKLVADPHPDDKEFLRAENSNWYEPGTAVETMLHEFLYD
jgi:hypothetical protein